ncbi:sugar transferase [Tsuneonella sp. CC-YZS046]|uniref:sugar transferase n=1 Tax=Tsuneonella sp. CC-YZS046 TaxID=3042152 RepID=UPI002D77FE73|nr:sugar transferase [Tsuneonella sp. CC-YZS046]WRO66336.1 sugar transferase [Tsuneonella sp. CC-YZS046]
MRLHVGLLATDAAIIIAGMGLAGLIYRGEWLNSYSILSAQLMVPIFLTIGLYNGTYSLASLNRFRTAAQRVVTALAVSAALLSFMVFFLKAGEALSRFIYALGLVLALCGMLLVRYALDKWIKKRLGPTLLNILLIDAGGPEVSLRDAHRIDAEQHGLSPSLDDPLGLDRLGRAMRNMDRVVVSCSPERQPDWALVFRAAAVDGEIVSLAAHDIGAVGVRHSHDFSTLVVSKGPLSLESRAIKRLFDLTLSVAALIVLAPVMIGAAIAIKLEDGGPIFFRQQRMGRANRLFTIYKFRSMRVSRADHEGHRSTAREDDRITRTGRLLRSWSIDELPQLWNIILGDMSIVGPRPHALGSLAGTKRFWEVDRRYWQRHALKPGLTGLAQIRGLRGATEAEDDLSSRLRADLEYLSGWNILRDIGIVILTLRVIVHERAF